MNVFAQKVVLHLVGSANKMVYFGFILSLVIILFHQGSKRLHGDDRKTPKRKRLLLAKILWMLPLLPWILLSFFNLPLSFAFNLVGFAACGRFVTARLMGYRIRTSLIEALVSFGEFYVFVELLIAINDLLLRYLPWILPVD